MEGKRKKEKKKEHKNERMKEKLRLKKKKIMKKRKEKSEGVGLREKKLRRSHGKYQISLKSHFLPKRLSLAPKMAQLKVIT